MKKIYLSGIISLAVTCGIISSSIPVSAETQEKDNNENSIATKIYINNIGSDFKLSDLKIRYYLKDENIKEDLKTTANNTELILQESPYYLVLTPDTQVKIHKLSKLLQDTDSYIETSFNNQILVPKFAELNVDFSVLMETLNNFSQKDDYSYNKGPVAYIKDKIVFGKNPDGINSANKANLNDLYNNYKETEKGDYTFNSYLNFKEKLKSAKKKLDDECATQEEVDKESNDLSQAISQLQIRNYSDENITKIDIIDKHLEDMSYDYEKEIRNGLLKVVNKKNITENDILDSICNEIRLTTKSRVLISNNIDDDLQSITSSSIINSSTIDDDIQSTTSSSIITSSTIDDVQSTTSSSIIISDNNYSQKYEGNYKEIISGEIYIKSNDKISEYAFRMTIAYANEEYRKKIKALYDSKKNIQNDNYTTETWDEFIKALYDANLVLNDKKAFNDDIDYAYIVLENAFSNLKKNHTTQSSSSHSSSSHSSSSSKTLRAENETISNNQQESVRKTGWILKDGKYYYILSNGNYLRGWLKDDNGKSYYFDLESAAMWIGWFQDNNGKWYYFDLKSGEMHIGWFQDSNSKWYYFDLRSGIMKTGWFQDSNGKWYYFDLKSGAMKTGWFQDSNGKWYYFDLKSGAMNTGWFQDISGKWYYFDLKSGAMKTGWFQDTNGKWYHFDLGSGAMNTGWFQDIDDKWYYLDLGFGVMNVGWFQDIDDKWYYLNENGSLVDN